MWKDESSGVFTFIITKILSEKGTFENSKNFRWVLHCQNPSQPLIQEEGLWHHPRTSNLCHEWDSASGITANGLKLSPLSVESLKLANGRFKLEKACISSQRSLFGSQQSEFSHRARLLRAWNSLACVSRKIIREEIKLLYKLFQFLSKLKSYLGRLVENYNCGHNQHRICRKFLILKGESK